MNNRNSLNKYFLSLPPSPDREWAEHDLEISSWDEGISWRIPGEESAWRSNYNDAPNFSLRSLFAQESENKEWKQSIPNELIQPLLIFEERHWVSMYQVVWILSRGNEAKELFLSTPYLFYTILRNVKYNRIVSNKRVLRIFNLNPCDMLRLFDLPCDDFVLSFLGEIEYQWMYDNKNEDLWRHINQTNPYELTRFCPRVNNILYGDDSL